MRQKYSPAGRWLPALLILLCLSWNSKRALAQEAGIEKPYVSRISGANNELAIGAHVDLTYPPDNEETVVIRNIITLSLNEEATSYLPDNFSATVTVKIEYGASPSSVSQISQDLTVTYNKDAGAGYNPKKYLSFSNARYVKITVTGINASSLSNGVDPKTVLLLQNEMRAKRFYQLSTGNFQPSTFTSNPAPASPTPDALPISWEWPAQSGNNQTELEWTWVEDELLDNYKTNGTLDYNLLFRDNATRVELPVDKLSYEIPLFYDGQGAIYYRIRAVSQKSSGSRIVGPWSSVKSYPFAGHNNDLNWQVSTSFAEDGKRKSVIQYFDGSLRMRQTVTTDNTTHTTVSAETFYDGQGRAAIQVLPAPGINSIVAYRNNLNIFNSQPLLTDGSNNYDNPALSFDLQPIAGGSSGTPGLAPDQGSSLYYSPRNPEIGQGANKNLPDAQGYAYAVTRYTPDATDRVMAQSGVGDAMKMGSGHETKYYYGNAAQEELDGLFGTEVGNFSHYFKNMVKDANNQMSVSYVDMHGRTIATALAGDAPSGMQALTPDESNYPGQSGKTLQRNLLDKGSNVARGNSIETINSILVPALTNYHFRYRLNPEALELTKCNSDQKICYDCMYDLEITITDESGDRPPIVRRFNNVSLSADNTCNTAVTVFSVNPGQTAASDLSNNIIQFDESLPPGSYSVRKTLTISESALQKFRGQYTDPASALGVCKTEQELIDSVYNVLLSVSDCNTPSNPVIPSTNHRLSAIRTQMLMDMMPYSGQYAKDLNDPATVHCSGSTCMLDKYNIFSTVNSGQPFYKQPWNSSQTKDYYHDAFEAIDPSIHPDPNNRYQLLDATSASDFANQFARTWAEALLPHHPEFAQLKWAEDKLSVSYDWIEAFDKIETSSTAVSNNYMNSAGHPEEADPFFTVAPSYKSTMSGYVNTSYYQNLSLWQIAYGDAACKMKTDLNERDNCYRAAPKELSLAGLTPDQQVQVWTAFKGLYEVARESMVIDYIKTSKPLADAQYLIDQGYMLRFANTQEIITQNKWDEMGFPTTAGDPPTVSLEGAVNAAHESRCSSYIESWKQALLKCPTLAASPDKDLILSQITAGMAAVCKKGIDDANPYGSSSVKPSTPQDGSPRSFEEVVNSVFAAHNISKDQYCNPFVIEFPKPYGAGPVFTKEVITGVDSCTCTQFSKVKQAATTAGYTPSSLSSLNLYLASIHQDALTQTLFDGLQKCNLLGTSTCRTVTRTLHYRYDQPNPCTGGAALVANTANAKGFTINSTAPTPCDAAHPDCTVDCTTSECEIIKYIALASPQPQPAFLSCGDSIYDHCISCSKLSSYVSSYKAYFGGKACAAAPVLSTDNLTPEQISYNVTFQQYVNYYSGLQFNWMDYVKAASAANCNLAAYASNGSANQNVLCADNHPLNDATGIFVNEPPCQRVYDMAINVGHNLYIQRRDQLLADFEAKYRAKCMAAKDIEEFSVQYNVKEYHYTLYYYDMAGNLVKTVPPKGARPDFSNSFTSSVEAARIDGTVVRPAHLFATDYRYNSLNRVVVQSSPDAGISKFWYDLLGRLAVSQNAQQQADGKYSYTLYDPLGRITEVGQKPQSAGMSQATSQNVSSLNSWINSGGGTKETITSTVYDLPVGFSLSPLLESQHNLRNRVSYMYTKNLATDVNFYTASYYTYDVHGNVDTLIQDYIGVSAMDGNNHYKRICYDYDLISGKVNGVDYQPSSPDAFYHRYQYDAENRLVQVQTSRDSIVWERDAAYSYYKHGPLSRMDVGQLQAQRLNYSYTLQGWLKGINMGSGISGGDNSGANCPSGSALDDAIISNRVATGGPTEYTARNSITFVSEFESGDNDLFETNINNNLAVCTPTGGSGTGSGITEDYPIGQDAYSLSLHYYPGDYLPVGNPMTTSGILEGISGEAAPLFNGNVAAMAVNIPTLGPAKVYNYHYDQLNRLVQMDAFNGLNSSMTSFTPVKLDDYKERISYDPNGNILTYLRNGTKDGGKQVEMDNLTYNYYTGNNQLKSINDNVNYTNNYAEDIDNQPNASNYSYDGIGNLKKDIAAGIDNISWTVYGKIASITKSDGTTINYSYDAAGNRISKTVGTTTTVYVRDAQGNVVSVYQRTGNAATLQKEIHLYGSSRLGMVKTLTVPPTMVSMASGYGTSFLYTFTRGEKLYELTNHLGNVLATITDKKIAVSSASNSSLIDHYTADVATAQDYYPFGMGMPGRSFTGTGGQNYRYGFNGQEKSDEIKGLGNSYTAEFWEYDPRLGRRWNIDPIVKEWESSYSTFGDNPVLMIDPDGMDWYKDNKGADKGQVRWYDGSGKRKGMTHLGATYDGYTMEAGGQRWMNGNEKGEKSIWMESVVVTATKKVDHSLMGKIFPGFNEITPEKIKEWNLKPKPIDYDPNPLKTIFWETTIGLLNPVKDIDVYVSGSLKVKVKGTGILKNASGTIVYAGIQGGFTTADGQGLYGNLITGDNSYLSYKVGNTELRGLPFRSLMPKIQFGQQPKYGDWAPQFRVINDIGVYRGILIQSEFGMGANSAPAVGLRGKVETPRFLGWNAELVGGARLTLQAPPLYNAIMQYFK